TDADLLQHRLHDSLFVLQQRRQQMERQQLRITVLGSKVVAALYCFLRLHRKFLPTNRHKNSSNNRISMEEGRPRPSGNRCAQNGRKAAPSSIKNKMLRAKD